MLQPEGAPPDARVIEKGYGERRRAQSCPQLQRRPPQLQVEEKWRRVGGERRRNDELPVRDEHAESRYRQIDVRSDRSRPHDSSPLQFPRSVFRLTAFPWLKL